MRQLAPSSELESIFSSAERRVKEREDKHRHAAEESLKASRRKYLKHMIMLKELDNMVSSTHEYASASPATVLPPASTKVLMKRIQVARAMQQLRISPSGDKGGALNPIEGSESSDVGCLNHVLGVDGDAFVKLHLRNDKYEQSLVNEAVTVLEERLQARATSMSSAVEAASSTSSSADHTTPGGTPSSLVERVALQSHALEQCRKETKVVLTQFLDNAMRCAQILTEMHTYLATFIQRSLLEKQQTLDQFNVDLTLAHCRSLAYKLGTVKLQLMAATYTHDNVAALAVLAGHLRSVLSQTQTSLDQVCKQMAIYRQLGPEFEEVVQEYGRVKAELVQAQARLDIFNQMENELMPR